MLSNETVTSAKSSPSILVPLLLLLAVAPAQEAEKEEATLPDGVSPPLALDQY